MKKTKVILSALLMAAAISFTACSNASSGSDSDKTEKEDKKTPDPKKPGSGNGGSSGGGNQTPAVTYIGSKAPTAAKTVGDIVFTDGSATPYYMVNSLTAENKQAAIAIIFYVGNELNNTDDTTTVRTLGLGLKHKKTGSDLKWTSGNARTIVISTISCTPSGSEDPITFDGDKNGFDNLSQIGTYLTNNSSTDDTGTTGKYPAFEFAKNYKNVTGNNVSGTVFENGWYLPGIAELYQIYLKGKSQSKVFDLDAALQILGGDKFEDGKYWSSSQHATDTSSAYQLSFKNGEKVVDRQSKSYDAYFCAIRDFTTYTVTLNTAEHGTITANKTSAMAGETITLTATGSETESYAYKVSSFTINGQSSGSISDDTYTFTMPAANVTVSTNFTQMPFYSITITPCIGGTVTANKTRAIEGETITLTVTPTSNEESDFEFKSLSMNGSALSVSNNTATFKMPAESVTISAEFESKYIGTKKPTAAKAVGDIVFNDGSAMPYSMFENLNPTVKATKKTSAIALIFYKGNGLNKANDTTTVRTLGVGLKRSDNLSWCLSSDQARNIKIETIISSYSGSSTARTFSGDKYGKDNFEAIATFLENATGRTNDTATAGTYAGTDASSGIHYMIFAFVKNYKNEKIGTETTSRIPSSSEFANGWYIPSIAELWEIYRNGMGANKVFNIENATANLGVEDFYISAWSSSQCSTDTMKILYMNSDGSIEERDQTNGYGHALCIREF